MGGVYNPSGYSVSRFIWWALAVGALAAVCVALALADENAARPFGLIAAVLAGAVSLASVAAAIKLRRAR